MAAQSKGAPAPAENLIDPNTLCDAIDLLDEAEAISVFMASTNWRDVLSSKEKFGFNLIMCDIADRIKKASSIVDEYREGVSHG